MGAPKGNKYNQVWTLENALPRFEDALNYAIESEDCLCMQDAVLKTGIPTTTFYYLVDNHKVLKSIKQDINNHIISRVNKYVLRNKFASSPAIWRMKQLGERDEQSINHSSSEGIKIEFKKFENE